MPVTQPPAKKGQPKPYLATVTVPNPQGGRGEKRRYYFASSEEANLWEAQARANIAAGLPVTGPLVKATPGEAPARRGGVSLAKLREEAIKHQWTGNRDKARSVRQSAVVVDLLGPDRDAGSLKAEDVLILKESLSPGRENATVNRYLACLKTMLRCGQRLGLIQTMPVVWMAKENQPREYVPDEAAEARIVKWATDNGHEAWGRFVEWQIHTGMRASESTEMTWDMLHTVATGDGERMAATLPKWLTKSSKARTVRLNRVAARALEAQRLAAADLPGPWVVCGAATYRSKTFRAMNACLQLTDEPTFSTHSLRHACGTRMANRGASLPQIMRALGHTQASTTARYMHVSDEGAGTAFDLLD